MLLNEGALRLRVNKVYDAMKQRAKPKYYSSMSKKAGQLRVVGIEKLPFTKQQLWDWVFAWIGAGAVRCPYCEEIGRNAALLTLEKFHLDHKVPLAHGGSWELDNLIPVCEECNREKGSLSYEGYIRFMRNVYSWSDQRDRSYVIKCLRTHGQGQRFQWASKKKPGDASPFPSLPNAMQYPDGRWVKNPAPRAVQRPLMLPDDDF